MQTSTLKISAFLLAAAAATGIASGAASARTASSPESSSAATRPQQTGELPAGLRPALYAALATDTGTSERIDDSGCVSLLGRRLRACFDGNGAHIRGAGTEALALRLSAYGRGSDQHSVAAVRPVVGAGGARYLHGALTEWWRVLPAGLEQGFTISKRPAGRGELVLTLAANARAARHGMALGWDKLRYGGLVVTDADGRVVPSKLETRGKLVLIAMNDAGARYPLTVDPLVWLQQKVSASDGMSNDAFGFSVAIDGSTAIIGADGAAVNGNPGQGAAYVFTESNGTWSQTAKLTASDGVAGDEFGDAVALYGNTAVIGAYDVAVGGNSYQGAAYVFTESGGAWSQTAKLTASDGAAWSFFGSAVALDGSTAVIGADNAAVGGNSSQGEAYVFTESGGTWTQRTVLTASDGAANDYFGDSVALNGSMALVGADGATINGNAAQGAVYVFTQSGGNWSQAAKLTSSDGAANDYFGNSVALSGSTAVVGARYKTLGGNIDQGAAYVFDESGGSWSQTAELTAGDGGQFDNFGWSVALDGDTAVIGADDATVGGNSGQGAAYVFSNSGGAWSQTQKLAASDGASYDTFGYSVALSGGTALIGAYTAAVGGNYTGAAYFYGSSDLDLTLNAPATIGQGQDYVSQTVATNNSSTNSSAVTTIIPVPSAVSFIGATATQGSCSEGYGVVTCSFGQIAGNGGEASANVTLKATGSVGDTIYNTTSLPNATPPLGALVQTQITAGGCAQGYTEYDGTLAAGGRAIEPGGHAYQAPAGQENGVLTAPAGFGLYVVYQGTSGRHVYRAPGNALHHYGPAGHYAWVVKAGTTGGSYSFCLKHP